MAVEVEVIGKNYWSRRNGVVQRLPVGTKMVVKGVPEALKDKLRVIKEVDDGQLIVNDNPEASKLRAEGKVAAADKLMSEENERKAAADTGDEELDNLRASYTELTGDEPDKRWKAKTIIAKIDEAAGKTLEA